MRDIHSAAVLPVVLSVLLFVLDLLVVSSFATPVGKLGEFMILLNLTGVIYWFCCGQLKLATALEFFQYRFSDSFGGNPPLYSCGLSAL